MTEDFLRTMSAAFAARDVSAETGHREELRLHVNELHNKWEEYCCLLCGAFESLEIGKEVEHFEAGARAAVSLWSASPDTAMRHKTQLLELATPIFQGLLWVRLTDDGAQHTAFSLTYNMCLQGWEEAGVQVLWNAQRFVFYEQSSLRRKNKDLFDLPIDGIVARVIAELEEMDQRFPQYFRTEKKHFTEKWIVPRADATTESHAFALLLEDHGYRTDSKFTPAGWVQFVVLLVHQIMCTFIKNIDWSPKELGTMRRDGSREGSLLDARPVDLLEYASERIEMMSAWTGRYLEAAFLAAGDGVQVLWRETTGGSELSEEIFRVVAQVDELAYCFIGELRLASDNESSAARHARVFLHCREGEAPAVLWDVYAGPESYMDVGRDVLLERQWMTPVSLSQVSTLFPTIYPLAQSFYAAHS